MFKSEYDLTAMKNYRHGLFQCVCCRQINIEDYLNPISKNDNKQKSEFLISGRPRTLENRENGQKKSLHGNIRKFEKNDEISGNLKKKIHCLILSKYLNYNQLSCGYWRYPSVLYLDNLRL